MKTQIQLTLFFAGDCIREMIRRREFEAKYGKKDTHKLFKKIRKSKNQIIEEKMFESKKEINYWVQRQLTVGEM